MEEAKLRVAGEVGKPSEQDQASACEGPEHAGSGAMKTLAELLAVAFRREIEKLTLADLDRVLTSDEHHRRTPSRNYGDRDPLSVDEPPIIRCEGTCRPALFLVDASEVREDWVARLAVKPTVANRVRCDRCQKAGPASLREWRAVINWNYDRACEGAGRIEDIPFFNLAGMPGPDALVRLKAIRLDLWLRLAQARAGNRVGRPVGGKYLAKIEAYLGWANVAILILERKVRSKGESSPGNESFITAGAMI